VVRHPSLLVKLLGLDRLTVRVVRRGRRRLLSEARRGSTAFAARRSVSAPGRKAAMMRRAGSAPDDAISLTSGATGAVTLPSGRLLEPMGERANAPLPPDPSPPGLAPPGPRQHLRQTEPKERSRAVAPHHSYAEPPHRPADSELWSNRVDDAGRRAHNDCVWAKREEAGNLVRQGIRTVPMAACG
jgi:hypothetical protein